MTCQADGQVIFTPHSPRKSMKIKGLDQERMHRLE